MAVANCDSPEELNSSMTIWKKRTYYVIGLGIIWMLVCGFLWPPSWSILGVWIGTMLIFILIGGLIGCSITNRWSGVFINERKLMSISRVQIAFWTLIILSAFFAIFIGRLRTGNPDPLNIVIDWQIWAILGISGASFAGRSLIAGNKSSAVPVDSDKEVQKASKDLKEDKDQIQVNSVGVLYANNCIKDAEFMDMFEADELRNTRYIDVGKLQMIFFTIIALLSYIIAIFALLYTTNPSQIDAFPPLSQGLVAILAISHAAFLGNSSITNTPVIKS